MIYMGALREVHCTARADPLRHQRRARHLHLACLSCRQLLDAYPSVDELKVEDTFG